MSFTEDPQEFFLDNDSSDFPPLETPDTPNSPDNSFPSDNDDMDHPLPNVETFSGRNPEQSASRWLRSIELHPFKNTFTFLTFVDTKLTGLAAEWSDQDPEIRSLMSKKSADETDKNTFHALFMSRWHTTVPRTQPMVDMTPLTQRRDENIPDFYRRVLSRLHLVGGRDDAPKRTVESRSNDYIV